MPGPIHHFSDFTLIVSTRELRRGDLPIALSPRAFDCLVYLIEHRDRAVGKDELVAAIWGRVDVSDTQLGQAVLRARRAVDDDGHTQRAIRTVSRFGYRWVADISMADGDVSTAPVAPASRAETTRPTDIAADKAPDAPGLGAAKRARLSGRRVSNLLLMLALLATVVIAAILLTHRNRIDGTPDLAALRGHASAIVMPLRVDGDASSAWLRLGAMDLIAERLRSGGLAVPPSENIVALLQAAHASGVNGEMRAIRHVAPDALIVSGDLAQTTNAWRADLRATAAGGAILKVESVRPDALDAARDAADRLLGRLGRTHPTAPPVANGLQERLQRAQAAMLANDLPTARAILVGDPELARSEPQLVYRLAQVDFRAGEYKRADAALSDLLDEPTTRNDALFAARVHNARGAVHIREDDYAGAKSDYDAAIALLGNSGHASERGLALTGRGAVDAMRHDFADALADLGQARVQLEEAGDALAIARVDSNLGGLEMDRDRPEQALPYLKSSATTFEAYGAINELMETLASLVSDNLALLRPADALGASDRSWILAPRVTDPNQRLNLDLDRVDVFLALGRQREAAALLGGLPDDAAESNAFVARRLHVLRARLALAQGRDAVAATEARRALGLRAPVDDNGEGVAEIALTYQRATLAMAPRTAEPPAQRWVPLQAPSIYPVQALLKAEWADARSDDAQAAQRFHEALDLAEQRGVPADVALVSAAYGPWLLRRGRLKEAGDVIGRVAPWAARDYDCALLQVRLFHALRQPEAWTKALAQANQLAGERVAPDDLRHLPP